MPEIIDFLKAVVPNIEVPVLRRARHCAAFSNNKEVSIRFLENHPRGYRERCQILTKFHPWIVPTRAQCSSTSPLDGAKFIQCRLEAITERERAGGTITTHAAGGRVSPKCPRNISETYPKRPRNIPETFPKYLRYIPETSRNEHKKLSKKCQNSSKNDPQ